MDSSHILSIVSFAGMVVMTIAFFWTQWKTGSQGANKELNTTTQEVISTYKTQVEQYKEQIGQYRTDMHNLTLEIGKLRGIIEEKDKKNKELESLLLAQNPDVKNFYREAPLVLKDIKDFMIKMDAYFEKSTSELHQQTQLLKK